LYADGINVHAMLFPRAEFRKMADGAIHNSFTHSLLAKGRLLYTHDETIADLCVRMRAIGERDRGIQLLHAGASALPSIDKAHKWWVTRRDLDYTALWILYAATPLAQIEVLDAKLLVDREVIPQAMKLNPGFFSIVYADLINQKKTPQRVEAALGAVDRYIDERAGTLFAPVVDHLRDIGEARSCKELEDYFKRHFDIRGVITVCEYLADRGTIGKVSTPAQLTRKSNITVEEMAFFYLDPR
jgi:hypothetical protein